ncbi:MAG: hypothetical protein RLY58_331 [Pseudomonadota bacterium]|jgi:hypothetical protein
MRALAYLKTTFGLLSIVSMLITLSFLLYFKVMHFEYVWDDTILFANKADLINKPLSWNLISQPVLAGTSYLRPLVFLSFFTEFHLFGQHPMVSHIVNLSFYILNVILTFLLAKKILVIRGDKNSTLFAGLAGLLYLSHPALVESVAWISGRFDLMVTSFILMTCIVFLTKFDTYIKSMIVGLLFFCALLCKELALITPILLFCVWMSAYAKSTQSNSFLIKLFISENLKGVGCLAVWLFGYLVIRKNSINGIYHIPFTSDYVRDVLLYELMPFKTLGFYLIETFLPFHNIGVLHPLDLYSGFGMINLMLIAIAVSFLVFLFYMVCKLRSASAWLAVAYLICLLLVLNIIPLSIVGNIGHERFMTTALSFISISLVLPNWSIVFNKHKFINIKFVLSVFGFWLILSFMTVISILPFWANELQLWNWAFKTYPKSTIAHYNYLYAAFGQKQFALIDQQIEREKKEKGALDVSSQIVYADRLIATGNAEGMRYLEGVIFALPKFHDEPDGKSKIDSFMLTHNQLGGVYSAYAVALISFGCDPKKALDNINIALWYLDESERLPLYYQQSVIYSILGDAKKAKDIWSKQDSIAFFNKVEYANLANNMHKMYLRNKLSKQECPK